MKFIEIANNLQIPINNEEDELLKKFRQEELIYKSKLTDRERVVANHLVMKDVLIRKNENGKIYFKRKIKL